MTTTLSGGLGIPWPLCWVTFVQSDSDLACDTPHVYPSNYGDQSHSALVSQAEDFVRGWRGQVIQGPQALVSSSSDGSSGSVTVKEKGLPLESVS